MKRIENKLQVLINGNWQYVFCYDQWRQVVTTQHSQLALKGDRDYFYFKENFAQLDFRIV